MHSDCIKKCQNVYLDTAQCVFIVWLCEKKPSKVQPVIMHVALLECHYGHTALWFEVIQQTKLSSDNWSPPQLTQVAQQCLHFLEAPLLLVNPRRACTARVTVLGLCVCLPVCLSTTILALHATRQLMSDTNSFSTKRARKIMWQFC